METEMDKILARYFCGEATRKELRTLEHWLAESDENEKQFHQMNLLYQYVGETEVKSEIDTEKALTKFKTYISEKQNSKTFLNTPHFYRIAAAIAILLTATFAIFYFLQQPSKINRLMAVEDSSEYEIFENTNVTLFTNAEIIYNSKSKQEIQLKGKATFKVDSKTSGTGIVVQAGETFIKDIGTIFTVDATEPDRFITVEVSEGEVWFYTNTNKGVHLKRNESAVYDVQKKQFNMELIFQNTPLREAIEMIKKRYGVDIIIQSETLSELFLNASFDKNDSVENVLEIIVETIGAQMLMKENVYIITL